MSMKLSKNHEWIDKDDGSRRFAWLNAGEESHVKQDEKDACDVNKILEKWAVTGTSRITQEEMRFLDNTEALDFTQAMNLVADANSTFAQLPAKLRKELKNRPENLFDFVKNKDNHDLLMELGLVEPVEAPLPVEPTPVVVVQPENAPN